MILCVCFKTLLTDAATWTSAEGQEGVLVSTMRVLGREALRVEFLRVREDFRVHVRSQEADDYSVAGRNRARTCSQDNHLLIKRSVGFHSILNK